KSDCPASLNPFPAEMEACRIPAKSWQSGSCRVVSVLLRTDGLLEPAEVESHRHGHLDGDDDEQREDHLAEHDQRRERAVALLLDLEQVVELLDEMVLVPGSAPLLRPA